MKTKQWILKQTVIARDLMLENLEDMRIEGFTDEEILAEEADLDQVETLLRVLSGLPDEVVELIIERIMQPEG